MAWRIEYLASVQKSMKKIAPADRRRIRDYMEKRVARLDDPRQSGKRLTGQLAEFWRYRVGDYRVVCDLQDGVMRVLVVRIGHRSKVYGEL